MMNIEPFTTAEEVRTFMFSGDATLTIKSRRSGERFTFRVSLSDDGQLYWVKVLTGPDNTRAYQYLGHWRGKRYFTHGSKSKIGPNAPSTLAYTFLATALERGGGLPPLLEVLHEGRCGRCHRKLTVPSSIKSGIGPDCAEKMGILICEEAA
jgi:hypothetical protein